VKILGVELRNYKKAIIAAFGIVFVLILWLVLEKQLGWHNHSPEVELAHGKWSRHYIFFITRGMLTLFAASAIFLVLAMRSVAAERSKFATELQAVNQKLREMAVTDGVTGLYNHRYFELTLEREWQKMRRLGHTLACVMIDLDDFKKINDTYGHHAGDVVLRQTAQILQREFREIDIVSRYGGEEFVVLMSEKPSHAAGLLVTMERVRKKIADQQFESKGKKFRVTGSLGGAIVPHVEISHPEDLVKSADRAMYCAKQSGKNCSQIFETMTPGKKCCTTESGKATCKNELSPKAESRATKKIFSPRRKKSV